MKREEGTNHVAVAGRAHPTPVFFFSVSSVKANLRPSEYLNVLLAAGVETALVSAYDLATADMDERAALLVAAQSAAAAGVALLLDSGNYESYWMKDADWTPEAFSDVLRFAPSSLVFCFDNQEPPQKLSDLVDEAVAAAERDQAVAPAASVCPIVHGRGLLPHAVREVGKRLQPVVIAVAERELGDGVIDRARTVRAVRAELDEVAPNTCLHLLGTGNPISMLIYAIAGAQSFDGLEWCRTCVDPRTARLHHFQQRELVSEVEPGLTAGLSYSAGTLLHNIAFFRSWLDRVRGALTGGSSIDLLRSVLPPEKADPVCKELSAL